MTQCTADLSLGLVLNLGIMSFSSVGRLSSFFCTIFSFSSLAVIELYIELGKDFYLLIPLFGMIQVSDDL